MHHFQRRLGAHGFVAVHVVTHPHDRQFIKRCVSGTAIHAVQVLQPNVLKPVEVVRMREDNCVQGTLLIRRTVLDVRGSGLCAYVLGEVRYFVVQAKAVAQVETEEFTRVLQGFLGVKSARYPGQ